jgi:curved DNA-binding protein
MEFKDYYKILGISSDAEEKDIKTAYRKLARKYHPDVSDHHDAENKFKEVTEAYQVLKDTEKRANYDELLQYGHHGQNFEPPPGWQPSSGSGEEVFSGNFSEFFESLFGAGRAPRGERYQQQRTYNLRGQDIELEMPVFLEDTLAKESKQIAYQLPHYDVNGNRLADIKKTLNVTIPPGVSDGEHIRLKGQGAPGIGEAPDGDLYLLIRLVPHPLFDIEGHNLILTVPLAPWEAALGAKVVAPTLTGNIQLTIPPDSQSGQRLRIKGKGLVGKNGNGDLYAVLKIVNPVKSDNVSRKLWEQLAAESTFDPRTEWRK